MCVSNDGVEGCMWPLGTKLKSAINPAHFSPFKMAENMRTSRGKPLMVLEGFAYVQHKLSSEGKQLWRCVQQRKFKCGGRAISDMDLGDFRATQEHASHGTQASFAVEKESHRRIIWTHIACGERLALLSCSSLLSARHPYHPLSDSTQRPEASSPSLLISKAMH
ncbi:hypothetical protein L596_022473 [Steinernema carpocapsae]|uniref:FLYWCH-type domain-containing protein n=1 Tax=Steinernema carpocapsae TaxID=34508 RepID=A0A4U5MMP0_STECR|nr:hypothetical protein L596_022473 [Steinernema carpocapsae]